MSNVFCYHDPDLNYHLSQVQKVSNCDKGYSYPAPAVQLSNGIKSANIVSQYAAPAYAYNGYSGAYQAPKITYAQQAYRAQPAVTYHTQPAASYLPAQSAPSYLTAQVSQPSATYLPAPVAQPSTTYLPARLAQPSASYLPVPEAQPTTQFLPSVASNYALFTKEVHGYATSDGLSTVSERPITPQATYAQAPIIAKVTGSPLIARFALAPARTTYSAQNFAQQSSVSGSLAKSSLNSYSNAGGPVVSQVYAAPRERYTTSQELRVVQPGYTTPGVQYSQSAAQTAQQSSYASQGQTYVTQGSAVQYAPAQYATGVQYASAVSPAPAVTQYASAAVSPQYATQVQYSAPTVQYAAQKYIAPAQYSVSQYNAPTVSQYNTQTVPHYASAPVTSQYTAPAVAYSPAVAVQRYTSPAVSSVHYPSVSHVATPVAVATAKLAAPVVKNVHTDFLENYVSKTYY